MVRALGSSLRALAGAVVVGLSCGVAGGQSLVVGTTSVVIDPGTPQQTAGPLLGFMTTGADMAGITVRAVFTDGSEEAVTWEQVVGPSGAALGTRWFLANIGDTFFFPWRLQNLTGRGIARIEIDGEPGNTLFDLTFGGLEGSPGSDRGHTFDVISGQGELDIRATYRDVISVDGAPPVGDLFRRLTIEFLDDGGLPSRLTALRFMADTDNAVLAGDLDRCCQPWDNGGFDERFAQMSMTGYRDADWQPFERVAADDFWLCEGQVHHIGLVRGLMTTNSLVPKARVIIYEDCDGTPGRKIAEASTVRTLDDELDGTVVVEETGETFEGLRIVAVEARFDKVFLKGGQYWVSIVGFSGTADPLDEFFWGSSGDGAIKGRPALFHDSDVGTWEGIEALCCGCSDLNFCVIGESCKILLDNGSPAMSQDLAGLGLPSLQNGAATSTSVRSADQFVVPPCEDQLLCYVEGYIWTNCPRVALEIYEHDCHCPSARGPVLRVETDCLIPMNVEIATSLGRLQLYRAVFADFQPHRLRAGRNYWVSLVALGDGRQNARGYFACATACATKCVGHFDPACTRGPAYATSSWVSNVDGVELAFLVAVAPAPDRPTVIAPPRPCPADVNSDGTVSVQDLFDFLTSFFTGCP